MNEAMRIQNDDRPIKSITMGDGEGNYWIVGRDGVTSITVYEENGQMAGVT